MMDRQRLELRRNAYDAFVTLPRMAPELVRRYFHGAVVVLQPRRPSRGEVSRAATRVEYEQQCALPILPTSDFPWSVPMASRRWRRVMRWRRGDTDVALVVRAGHARRRARDPFAYYGLPPLRQVQNRAAPVSGPAMARRLGYLSFALGRAIGTSRADVLFTRDLGVASLLVERPARLRPPVAYESHGYAPTSPLHFRISCHRHASFRAENCAAREARGACVAGRRMGMSRLPQRCATKWKDVMARVRARSGDPLTAG